MSDIILTDNAGNLLQITTGMAVKITYPVPAGMKDCLPPTIPLWEFDDATGTWRETTTTTTGGVTIAGEGATLQGEEYVGYITILEWGNLDYPSKRIDIEIRIVDTTKKPIQGAIIYIGPISQTVSVEYPPNTTKPGDPPKKVSPPTPDDKKPGQTAIPTGPDGKGRGRIPRNEECNPQIDYRIEIWVWVKINHVWGYHRYIYNPPTPPEPGEVLPIPDIEVGGGGTAMPDLTEVEVVPLNKTESFTMGCTIEDGDCTLVEYPAHSVTLSHYYMQTHLITQLYWESIMGSIPASNNDECLSCPVFVQWLDIVGTETENGQDMDVMTIGNQTFYENGFIYKLNKKTGKKYRLPTEAEWEYAARGGKYQGLNNKYSGSDHIDNVAWYNQNSDFRIHPVGEKHPNVLGIYDMSGNVWEWCYDYYLYNYYTEEPQTNPTGPETGWERVVRGGSYLDAARECRVSFRIGASASYTSSYVGVRLVRVE
jgi:formylglycine-generating enzyme required for sulfatase activity